jgi:hypothetical protein
MDNEALSAFTPPIPSECHRHRMTKAGQNLFVGHFAGDRQASRFRAPRQMKNRPPTWKEVPNYRAAVNPPGRIRSSAQTTS